MFDKAYYCSYESPADVDIFEAWRPLIGNTAKPFMITILGDAFFAESDGSIFYLQADAGNYNKVADNVAQFEEEFAKNYNDWVLPELAEILLKEKGPLPPNSCFSMEHPLFLGGEISIENYDVYDFYVHFDMLGNVFFAAQKAEKELYGEQS